MFPNFVSLALSVSPDDEEHVIGQVIMFAFDDELIRVSRNGAKIHVLFWEPLDENARLRLEQLLHREITPVSATESPAAWRTVHEFGPEDC